MNENDFAAGLIADGYTEIATQRLEPRPAEGQHGHHFAIRGLVLAGSFTVTQDNLCVPKIRFGVDAAGGRRKLAS
jgi:hypothetical protein